MYTHPTVTVDDGIFTIADIPGKGRGMRAGRPITAGEVVLSETPLFIKPLHSNYRSIVTSLSTLPESETRAFRDLDNRYRDQPTVPIVVGIFKTNALPLNGNDPSVQGDAASRAGLLLLGSRINHSCCPNVTYRFDEGSGKFIFRAIQDIAWGEELCISYKCTLLAPRNERRVELQRDYSFVCVCNICLLSGNGLARSDWRRSFVRGLRNEALDDHIQPLAGMEKVKQALPPLQREGLLGVYGATFCKYAFEFCILVSDDIHANLWGQKAWEAQYKLTGPGSESTRMMLQHVTYLTHQPHYGDMGRQTLSGPDF